MSEQSGNVRLEYESLFALGPLCGVSNADTVLRATQLCNDLGMDTISAGGTIAFAMECVQRGLIDEPRLSFGDEAGLLEHLQDIAYRRNLGNRLAEGSRRFAIDVGQGAMAFAPQVKGLELPGYEPRAVQAMALGFAVGTRGADHNRSGAYEVDLSERVDRRRGDEQSARLAVETENRAALMDSLIICKFLRGVLADFYEDAAEMLHLTTGWDFSAEELRRSAAQLIDSRKWFNIDAGWQPEDDTLPERFLHAPLPDDPRARLTAGQLRQMIRAYYEARSWNPEGFPLGFRSLLQE